MTPYSTSPSIMLTIEVLRKNATKFAKKFANVSSEKRHDQNFMRDFFQIFGIESRFIEWQYPVKDGKSTKWLDGVLLGTMLVEMKSAGENLDKAYAQAIDYIRLMKEKDAPEYVLISDFANLHFYNRITGDARIEIKLSDLPQKIEHFQFLTGYKKIIEEKQERINKEAAEKMADLHDAMKATGYLSKNLETYLIRLLFCLFADDTGLFGENRMFFNYLLNFSKKDGSDLHCVLNSLFHTLSAADDFYLKKFPAYQGTQRLKNIPEHLNKFTYINGSLFEGVLPEYYFDESTRKLLLDCAQLDWSEISPAIFGSLFQAIMHFDDEAANAKTKKRREFGAHYTSEENILKTINPLFMDDLRAEFAKIGRSKPKLAAFHKKLSELNFFDPACGCGNFLIIAYREVRLLELEVIKASWGDDQIAQLDVSTLILCDVDRFHGVDIDESAVHIARLAMWLVDHQMNLRVQELGLYYNRIPLLKKANIVCANALQIEWEEVIAPQDCSFIMGNPPFVGRQLQSSQQKADLDLVFQGMKGAGVLDLVAAWHVKAARYIQANKNIPVAFVSTNSLTQGEQVAILWTELLKLKIKLHFAHQTFRWSNEGKGVAAVHCVILGFGLQEPSSYRLFDYGDDISGKPIEIKVEQINPYLVDAPIVLIDKRRKPLSSKTPEMTFGNMPNDGGHLLLSKEEADDIKKRDSIAAKYIHQFLGADEFINNLSRYCLWLKNSSSDERIKSPEIKRRVAKVEKMRLESLRETTQELANRPFLFGEIRQTDQPYLLIPRHSSESRRFLPIGYFSSNVICGDANFMLPNASLYDFGLLASSFHNAWMRAVCGRIKSDYRYSNTLVYNNFPFPEKVTSVQKQKIAQAAQQILDARAAEESVCTEQGQKYSLATLYAAGNMPTALLKAHNALDKAVDSAYKYKDAKDDAARVAFLFELYLKFTAPLVETE
jgi:hypothetical protein